MRGRSRIGITLSAALLVVAAGDAGAPAHGLRLGPFVHDGPKLTAGEKGSVGDSVALSADGTTALVGATQEWRDGAAWVFERDASGWTRTAKLTRTGKEGFFRLHFGASVALSADGSTALVGDPNERSESGAAWVFTRSASDWSRQAKLLPTDETPVDFAGGGHFGGDVALSADGHTALVSGPSDDQRRGAAWVFARRGARWKQVGAKLTSPGQRPKGVGSFGASIALSADGRTALIGRTGTPAAAFVYVRSASGWAQQGKPLNAPPSEGTTTNGIFGAGVALSADGDTALVGQPGAGAAWVFTRHGSIWSRPDTRLAPGRSEREALFGTEVALSADGRTALVSAPGDRGKAGAAWVFVRPGSTWIRNTVPLAGRPDHPVRNGWFGNSVALSADGGTALVGAVGVSFRRQDGAAWPFRRGA